MRIGVRGKGTRRLKIYKDVGLSNQNTKQRGVQDNSLALLPNGFVDLLPPFAEEEAASIQVLMEKFSAFGYHRIKPPLLEFEDSLLAPGPGALLASETFRLMDPVSHRMLGIRSDITAQISRIVSSRLGNEPRPLRLMYANDVLRTCGGQVRTERQFAKVGCELIGAKGVGSDVEICVLSLLGLKSLGLTDITLDFTIPGFVSSLLSDVDGHDMLEIRKAVAQRDRDTLQGYGGSARVIAEVMGASGRCDKALPVLDSIACSDSMRGAITHLKQVCTGVEAAMAELGIDDVSLSIDVLEQDGFEYHKMLGFTLFSSHIRGELGRGGCYDVRFGQNENDEVAQGFTLYMDTVLKSVPSAPQHDKVFVPSAESWDVVAALQAQGWITVRQISENEQPAGCTHVYENGQIVKLI